MFTAIVLFAQVALGVGATDSNKINVLISGKETPVTIAGVSGGSERGAAFVRCLVAGRVVRIKGPRTSATVTMLDDSSVRAHVEEFLLSSTTADPCAIGKAAYQPPPLHAAVAATTAPAAPPPAAAVKGKKPVREVHVSFAPGKPSDKGVRLSPSTSPMTNEWSSNYRPPAPPPPPSNQPTVQQITPAGTYQPPAAGTYQPPQTTTASVKQGQTDPSLKQQGTQPLEQTTTQAIPTTTYAPPPPPV